MSPSTRFAGVAALGAVCALASGCSAIISKPRASSVIADVSLSISALTIADHVYCLQTNTGDSCEGYGIVVVGAPLLVTGLIAGGIAAGLDQRERPQPAPPTPTPEEVAAAKAADRAWMEALPELPDVATDEVTLRMARQVRAAAARGQCVIARVTMKNIAARDARYHAALASSAIVARCR